MLEDIVDEYIASLSVKEQGQNGTNHNTIMAYRNDLKQVCLYLRGQRIENWQQVTREHVAAYLLEMREGQAYRPTTIARKLAALKTFFRYMRGTGMIVVDPIEHLEAPRIQKEPPHILSSEQLASLFRQLEVETPGGKRDFAMLHMLYATGMRVGELVALDLDDFDAAKATIVCPGRNGRVRRERILPLSTIAVEATKQYLELARPGFMTRHPDEQALFVNHHGERLTRQGFWLIIKGYARQAGITTITPHMLRHSFAILMLQGGMELRSVQELLGHAHISTTQVYTQLARESMATGV
ncbi:MAG TPA: tyrosine-type recombinase/integrase [Ktedonobacteraceae bacterium]|nr:tyrosine-type recombinase/integrase [Ktedonobacteraceae bacterium]